MSVSAPESYNNANFRQVPNFTSVQLSAEYLIPTMPFFPLKISSNLSIWSWRLTVMTLWKKEVDLCVWNTSQSTHPQCTVAAGKCEYWQTCYQLTTSSEMTMLWLHHRSWDDFLVAKEGANWNTLASDTWYITTSLTSVKTLALWLC